jgi:hypothetical protein
MGIYVWLAYADNGSVMAAFRTRSGAIECLKDYALSIMDDRWTDEERAKVINDLETNNSSDGWGHVGCVGELGE